MRKMNPPTHVATMKRGTNPVVKKGLKESHNAKRMFDDAQVITMVHQLKLVTVLMVFYF
jgi:hypothetical protein